MNSGNCLKFSSKELLCFGVTTVGGETRFDLLFQPTPAERQADAVVAGEVLVFADATGDVVKLLIMM
ncbi:hypothetical protein SDC9_194199 [bioreactor metagenome]|uniref:Uncharacterized protein n=1 Tax=bioreactor metagenome TaxID=1076179 RepID=A0A645I5S7_9ZZZZ